MNNLFVPYEIALALKEMGFDEPCIGSYEDNKLSPPPVLHVSYSNQPINTSMWKEEYVETYKKRPKMFEGEEPKNSKMPQWKVAAPLYDQVIDWFDSKNVHIYAFKYNGNWQWKIDIANSTDSFSEVIGGRHDAFNAGILKAIELIKQKK